MKFDKRNIIWLSLAACILIISIVISVDYGMKSKKQYEQTPEVTERATQTPELTSTPEPTIAPTPTATAEEKQIVTATPTPEETPTAEPTVTPTVAPTETPISTATPTPRPQVTADKIIAFTFDDGPQMRVTNVLLDGLKERGYKATFFVVAWGFDVDRKPSNMFHKDNVAILLREYNEGHLIGNHSYSHKNAKKLTDEEILTEVQWCSDLIEKLTGQRPEYFRAPYGNLNTNLLEQINMVNVGWGPFDCEDWNIKGWKEKNPGKTDEDFENYLAEYIVSRAQDGDIVLMHDLWLTSVHAALKAMDMLAEKGFEFVTVDQLLLRNANENQTLSKTYNYPFMRKGDTSHLVNLVEKVQDID